MASDCWPNCIGTKRTESENENSKSNGYWTIEAMARPRRELMICIKNSGYEASLELRKVYVVLPEGAAANRKMLRVIDESGEDYLYPANFFRPLDVTASTRRAVMAAE
jgi:hypothetical protein